MSVKIDYNPKNGAWAVTASVRDTYDLKDIPGSRASRKTDPGLALWNVPGTIGAARQLHRDVPEAEWTEGALARRAELAAARKRRMRCRDGRAGTLFVNPEASKLTPLQEIGASFLCEGSGILADDMGSGKTVQACVAAAELNVQTTLVLTTVSTLHMWADHLREWAGIEPFIFHGPKRAAVWDEYVAWSETPKALISTHALALKHSARASFGNVAADGVEGEFNSPFDLGIIDEVHRMGLDPKAPGVRAMHRIAKNCGVRWAMSGTPVNERPDDMWNLMRFVDPAVLQDRGAFRKRYCIMIDTGFKVLNDGLHPDMIEEFDFLIQPYFLRRLKREVIEGLPEALPPQYIRLPLTSAQQTLYNRLVKEGLARLPSGKVIVAPSALDLSRVCEYVAQGIPEINAEGKVTSLGGPSSKLDYILDVMAERGPERPVVIFAHSPKVTAMLAEGLRAKHHRVAEIAGDTPAADRPALVQAFQGGSLDAMLITSAGAEGITLTASDLVIFVQESWRAITNQQTRDRIDRFGQTKATSTMVLIAAGTVDETKRKSQVLKIGRQQLTLRDKKELSSFLNGTWDAS